MNCPYCNGKMRRGVLRAGHQDVVYWLPDSVDPYEKLARIRTLVKKYDGVLLDEPSKIGFYSTASPYSHYCDNCRIFITKLSEDE